MPSELLRRAIATVVVIIFFVGAGVLLFADRSGSLVENVRDAIVSTAQRIERTFDFDVADRDDIPGTSDQMAHAAFWGSGMLIIGWILRKRVPVPITALYVAGASLAFEIIQPLVSSTREFQTSDIVGNLVGIVLGSLCLTAVLWTSHQVLRSASRKR